MHVCRHTVAAASRAADLTGPTPPLLGCRTCPVVGALDAGAAGAVPAVQVRNTMHDTEAQKLALDESVCSA